jgi:MFS family permease
VFSQFAGSSIWFAGNAVIADLQAQWGLTEHAVGQVTSAVQAGFITGTLVFALLMIADRLSPRLTFFLCSLLGASANAAILLLDKQFGGLLALRFATGFFLAGIYPVGMKIASGWYHQGLGRALGYLVGALVLGTAFPHLARGLGHALPWETVLLAVSGIAVLGGALMFVLVPDGPFLAPGSRFDPKAFASIFGSRDFRASVFGYFGHMWELYAFWAFVPTVLAAHLAYQGGASLNLPVWAFTVIAAGAVGCMVGGIASERLGSARVAFAQLLTSGICCLVSPLLFLAPTPVFLAFLLLWGVAVVGDSPQFSALNAQYAPKALVGSALTIGNCIGFAITVPSILLLGYAVQVIGAQYVFLALVPGPIFGLYALLPLLRR